jgi:hypothetical protein
MVAGHQAFITVRRGNEIIHVMDKDFAERYLFALPESKKEAVGIGTVVETAMRVREAVAFAIGKPCKSDRDALYHVRKMDAASAGVLKRLRALNEAADLCRHSSAEELQKLVKEVKETLRAPKTEVKEVQVKEETTSSLNNKSKGKEKKVNNESVEGVLPLEQDNASCTHETTTPRLLEASIRDAMKNETDNVEDTGPTQQAKQNPDLDKSGDDKVDCLRKSSHIVEIEMPGLIPDVGAAKPVTMENIKEELEKCFGFVPREE